MIDSREKRVSIAGRDLIEALDTFLSELPTVEIRVTTILPLINARNKLDDTLNDA